MASIHLEGTVHGRTIELGRDPGLAEGQRVELIVRPISPQPQWGEGLRRCAGAWVYTWAEEDDRILEQLQHERHADARTEISQ